jgi:hypothetical protein
LQTRGREVEACARELRATKRNTVKHNRGAHVCEAGNIRFGLEMRLAMGDAGLAIHVLADIGGAPGKKYTEETELLAFDHFWLIERTGYRGVAADLDVEKIASVLPAMKEQALEMWEQGRRLTGHPGLPLEPTPNLGAAD